MGMIGSAVGGFAGGQLGKHFFGKGGQKIGSAVGSVAGGLLPYKNGGTVKGSKKGKAVQIIAHTGEYILPIGVKPTKKQKAQVAKRKKK
jgi:uncharacterized protein YcfJ